MQIKYDFTVVSFQVLSSSKEKYPIFTFVDGRGQDYGLDALSSNHFGPPPHLLSAEQRGRGNIRQGSEEFVFL